MKQSVLWQTKKYKQWPTLRTDAVCDYLIVGGGVTGLTLAYFLEKQGKKKIILAEQDRIGSGASGRAAGALTASTELDLWSVIEKFGQRDGILLWHALLDGFHTIKQIIRKNRIRCDAEPELNIVTQQRRDPLHRAYKEYAMEKHFHYAAKILAGKQLQGYFRSSTYPVAVIMPTGYSINPFAYVHGLAATLKYTQIYQRSRVHEHRGGVAQVGKQRVRYKHIIYCTDTYSKDRDVRIRHTTIAVTKPLSAKQRANIGLCHKAIGWNESINYFYFKITKDSRLLIGFGDHAVSSRKRNTLDTKQLAHLRKVLRTVFPQQALPIEYAWSGALGMTKNLLPIVRSRGSTHWLLAPTGLPNATMAAKYLAGNLSGKGSTALGTLLGHRPRNRKR